MSPDAARLLTVNGQIAAAMHERLLDAPEALDFLHARGFTIEHAVGWHLGFAGTSWGGLPKRLREAGIAPDDAVTLGLIGRNERGTLYSRFRHRLMFPIRAANRAIQAFGGRLLPGLDPDATPPPKYINSTESLIYAKGRTLFGLGEAADTIIATGRVVICEGYFDTLRLHDAGVTSAVAPCGTTITPAQLQKLRARATHLTVAFDGDTAGRRATAEALTLAHAHGFTADVAELPDGDDPDTYGRREGRDRLTQLVRDATPSVTWALRYAQTAPLDDGDSVESRAHAFEVASRMLTVIPDDIARHAAALATADELGLRRDLVMRAFGFAA